MTAGKKQLLSLGDDEDDILADELSTPSQTEIVSTSITHKFKKKAIKTSASRRMKRKFDDDDELNDDLKEELSLKPSETEKEANSRGSESNDFDLPAAFNKLSRIKKYEKLSSSQQEETDTPKDSHDQFSDPDEAPVIVDEDNNYSINQDTARVLPLDAPPASNLIPDAKVDFFREKEVTLKHEYEEENQLDDVNEQEPTSKNDELEDVNMDDYLVEDGGATASDLIKQSKLRSDIHQSNSTVDKPSRRVVEINQDMYDLELSSGDSDEEYDNNQENDFFKTARENKVTELSKFKTLDQMIEHLTITIDKLSDEVDRNESDLQETEAQLSTIRDSKQSFLDQLSQ